MQCSPRPTGADSHTAASFNYPDSPVQQTLVSSLKHHIFRPPGSLPTGFHQKTVPQNIPLAVPPRNAPLFLGNSLFALEASENRNQILTDDLLS